MNEVKDAKQCIVACQRLVALVDLNVIRSTVVRCWCENV